MAWVNADDPWEVWVGSTPPTLQEWEEEGRKPMGQAMCHHVFLLSLAGWRMWRAWQAQAIKVALHHKAGGNKGNCLYTKPHKHNLLGMAGARRGGCQSAPPCLRGKEFQNCEWSLKKAEGTTAGGRKPKLVLAPGRASINSVFQMVVFILVFTFLQFGFSSTYWSWQQDDRVFVSGKEQVLHRPTPCFPMLIVFAGAGPGSRMKGFVTGSGEACLVLERWFCECLKWLGNQENTRVFTSFGFLVGPASTQCFKWLYLYGDFQFSPYVGH